jgi:hypothetical protein
VSALSIFAIIALGLFGCSHLVEDTVCFHDNTCRDVVTIEQKPSFLNTALVTSVEDPATKHVETTVQGGTSPGKAMVDTAQTASMFGFGAFVGASSSTNSVNISPAMKP